ncbi:hypothetical protein [Brevundimonas sp.]|jgi:hypothetical protein|uniref:hypothetical protein n=1 Tax=Brevundimonas sp. TaxID=1871086 RepID=UPI0025B907A8|nr:hypothetical protein [Brevundimonas sp.]
MSADEFDPAIERLFARTPTMPDAALFTAQVEQRMQKGSRLRVVVLGLAGLVGAVVAVREVVSVNVNLGEGGGSAATGMQGLEAVSFNAQTAIQSGLDQAGLGNLAFGSMSGMQMFWIAAGALIAAAAAGVVRLSQEV